MDIVLITNRLRPELLRQTYKSLFGNAISTEKHALVTVHDGDKPAQSDFGLSHHMPPIGTQIYTEPIGASRCRNIGAASIPKYRRQSHVMFIDDDVYMCPGWDEKLMAASRALGSTAVVSGYAHPFNRNEFRYNIDRVSVHAAGVLSTVNMMMPWEVWDKVGWFVEPGGPGGSEDVDWCGRASALGLGLAVTIPQCVIHTGMTGSGGGEIVGKDQLVEQNEALVKELGLEGRVVWQ